MASRSRSRLVEVAPAKVNLTLRVINRRRDGHHSLESLVAFASIGDRLSFTPGGKLSLSVRGRFAKAAGPAADNLVLRAALALAGRIPGLTLGGFALTKNIPVAAGLGGGSADAAAALRLLARANGIELSDARIWSVAGRLGADVPVCLESRARVMRGTGDRLARPVALPRLAAVLVNPGLALSTATVFGRFDRRKPTPQRRWPRRVPTAVPAFRRYMGATRNDLEPVAATLVPGIAQVLAALRAQRGCTLARMTGSGATCFGLFASPRVAVLAARKIAAQHRKWWVRPVLLR